MPPPATARGSRAAATAPPAGVAMWRMPSARPRSPGPNQPTTARPLAALALAPSIPTATSASARVPADPVRDARTSAPAAPASPAAITRRSPIRSASAPQAIRVAMMPTVEAASRAPVPASDRW